MTVDTWRPLVTRMTLLISDESLAALGFFNDALDESDDQADGDHDEG